MSDQDPAPIGITVVIVDDHSIVRSGLRADLDASLDVVGEVAVDLDAAIHRAGMHDQRVRLGRRQLVVVEAEEMEIFTDRGDEIAGHSLVLKAKHHNDINIFQAVLHIVKDLDAKRFGL